MAKESTKAVSDAWLRDRDQSKLCVWVTVDQKAGTFGILEEVEHYGLPNEMRFRWAKVRMEATDPTSEAKWDVVYQLLAMHAARSLRAVELGIEPF